MKYFVFLYGIFSFFVVLFITPWLIRYLKKIGLVVKDQNKESKPLVPISGGLAVLFGIMAGLVLLAHLIWLICLQVSMAWKQVWVLFILVCLVFTLTLMILM